MNGYIEYMERMKNAYKIPVGKPEESLE